MRFLSLAAHTPAHGNEPGSTTFTVGVSVADRKVAFAEVGGHGASAGTFDLDTALGASWRGQFAAARGEWLYPYLQRLAAGEDVTESELVAHYESLHGAPPAHYDSGV